MSARLRLTLSYTAFLLLAAVAMGALLIYIIRFVPVGNLSENEGFIPDRNDLLAALWPKLLLVLGVLALIGPLAGWVLAGRMLRPLRDIHAVAVQVEAGSLHDRVRSDRPRDEFRDLADTFDAMLDRLQVAFDEQGRFAANASHELRTPYAIERAMLDVALANPSELDIAQLLLRLDETNRRGTETVEALLALAALDQDRTLQRVPVDLTEIAGAVVDDLAPLAQRAHITVAVELGECDLDGVEPLVRHLIANLVLNAIRHNVGPGGSVHVITHSTESGSAELRVVNTGPVVNPQILSTLTEPFVRGVGRLASPTGSGLGLAIVARVAQEHHAELNLVAPASGGLDVSVSFPPAAS